ncbi:unnamed protein product [Lymnaea stagnalis]|uniref:Uncharacterized protein n=1 Tax=Lymnaea stagnalis TaxID=6523 RepID=A0AAV2HM29_LYMST
MAQAAIPSQQRLAEKLTILNDSGIGMLNRLFNIKKMLGTMEFKPNLLKDKNILAVTEKVYLKKFPLYDNKAPQHNKYKNKNKLIESQELSVISQMKEEILKDLSLFYLTLVDVLMLKDHIVELLNTFDACQVQLDIGVNYDLTKGYLDLITTYVTIMIIISQIDDRKAVLALYNNAYEFKNEKSESSYHRLGQMFLEYDPPMKKLAEEFVPHSRQLLPALLSLQKVYPKKIFSAENLRKYNILAIFTEPTKLAIIPDPETIPCEYLSLNTLDKWIIYGFMLCYQSLTDPNAQALWKECLQSGFIITLHRNDNLHIHSYVINFFESLRGQNRRVNELKEFQTVAFQNSPAFHRERRKFLRLALRDLTLAFSEQPGLLGPKALYVFQALSMARDEVLWLLRHTFNLPQRKGNVKISPEDFYDRQLPELIFYMEELRGLVKTYREVIQTYYVQYLSGFDVIQLQQLMRSITGCSEDEQAILKTFLEILKDLNNVKEEKMNQLDFSGLRLDWFRLQAYTSISKSGLELKKHPDLVKHLNTVTFHIKMVDFLDEMLDETGDLSVYCFYITLFEHQFKQCMEFLPQYRYSIVFPLICGHFMKATHILCPEERISIGQTSLKYVHWLLKEMSEELGLVVSKICELSIQMENKLLPRHGVANAVYQKQRDIERNKEKKDKKLHKPDKPGLESIRKNRENVTQLDKFQMALTDLCFALDYCPVIQVWDHGFVPREFFQENLKIRFNKAIVEMAKYNPETKEIAKPSEVLSGVRAYMNVLQNIVNYISIDMTTLFRGILLLQTQPTDSNGQKTITHLYTQWYVDVLMNRLLSTTGTIVFSPSRKSFVPLTHVDSQVTAVEEFLDTGELQALVELISPYGMKYLGEKVMLSVADQVDEIKKLVVAKRDILEQLRVSFDKPETMSQLTQKLTSE